MTEIKRKIEQCVELYIDSDIRAEIDKEDEKASQKSIREVFDFLLTTNLKSLPDLPESFKNQIIENASGVLSAALIADINSESIKTRTFSDEVISYCVYRLKSGDSQMIKDVATEAFNL